MHEGIRKNADRTSGEAFWHTQPVVVEGAKGQLIISFLSTKEGNKEGVPEGVYAVTNVSPEDYAQYSDLRGFVRNYIHQRFAEIADFEG